MKRIICLLLCIVCVYMFIGCGKDEKESPSENTVRQDENKIDVDLTVLSSTMVYSEVYNMVNSPEEYLGKTVKMKGAFSDFYSKQTQRRYFTCVIADATACCQQGIEFLMKDTYKYPDDFPENGSEVTVTGVFDRYYENDKPYYQLINSDFSD